MIVAIDPGVHACGVAVFRDAVLERAEYIDILHQGGPVALARAVAAWTGGATAIGRVVVEKPQVYVRRLSKGDPNDLIDLAVVVGALLATVQGVGETVLPQRWKGSVPKDIMNARILGRLSDAEKQRIVYPKRKTLGHNVVDSVGIGLWALKRL